MQVRELVTRLGFDVDEATLKRFDRGIKATKIGLTALAAGATAAAGALAAVAVGTAKVGREIERGADLTGLSTDEFQRYRAAANAAGVANESFESSLISLDKAVGATLRGNQQMAQSFALLGIPLEEIRSLGRSDLFKRVADGMSRLNKDLRSTVSRSILGGAGIEMTSMLAKGSAEVERMASQFDDLTLSVEQLRDAVTLDQSLRVMRMRILGLRNAIGVHLMPTMIKLTARFEEWWQANQAVVRQNVSAFFAVLTKVVERAWGMFLKLVDVSKSVVGALGGLENTAKLAAAAMLAIGGSAVIMAFASLLKMLAAVNVAQLKLWLTNPYLLIAGAILLAILAVEDFYTFLQGGESVFGDFWKAFTEAYEKHVPEWLRDAIKVGGFAIRALASGFESSGKPPNHYAAGVMFPQLSRIPTAEASRSTATTYAPNTNVTVTVPAGTTSQQASFLEETVRSIVRSENDRTWSMVAAGNPRSER